MKTDEVGSFEAKTRFAELLRDVEAGHSYTITRKGRPVARLAPLDTAPECDAAAALRLIREARGQYQVTAHDLDTWRRTGLRGP